MSTILGPDGKPLDTRAVMRGLETPQTAELGAIRTDWARHPAKGLTPAKLGAIMFRAEEGELQDQLDLAEDMEERDAHLYAELGKRAGAVTALAWSIEEPKNASKEEIKLTERVRDWVGMLTCQTEQLTGGMGLLLSAMTSAVLRGFAPIELQWRLQADSEGRQVRVPHCTLQPQRWFTLSADRRRYLLRSSTQMTPAQNMGDGVTLPGRMGVELNPYAWLMHIHPARNGYLARMALARVLFWPYLFKNYAVRDFAEMLEIYGIPFRLGKYPSGASDEEKLTLLRAVTELGHNAAGIIPQGMALEFLAASAGTEVPFAAMWDRMDAAQSKAILGQTLSASEGQKGSHALGKVHNEVRHDIRDADARLYEESFSAQVIAPMCLINVPGVNPRRLPRLMLDTGEPEDLALYAQHLPTLAKAGVKVPVKWVHEKLRIPEPEEGEEVLQEPEPQPQPGLPGQPPGGLPGNAPRKQADKQAEKKAALAGQVGGADDGPRDVLDELVDDMAAQWQSTLAPMVEPLLAEIDAAVARGETLEAFAARLPELVRAIDAGPMTEQLARGAFAARLAGEANLALSANEGE
jgi:phage gp29-like protein